MGRENNGNRRYFEQGTLLDDRTSNYDGPDKTNPLKKGINGFINMIKDEERLNLYDNGRLMPQVELMNGPVAYNTNGERVIMDQPYYPPIEYPHGFRLPNRILGIDKNIFLVLVGVVSVLIFMELFQRKR